MDPLNLTNSLFEYVVSDELNLLEAEAYERSVIQYLESIDEAGRTNDHTLQLYSQKIEQIQNFEWLNVSEKLSYEKDLKGRLVLIDFWTYCCINCMHIIPLLNQLEKEFDELLVIGVHSSKFQNEKLKHNINHAIKRHLIKHPVVCDFELRLWNDLKIVCWPTLLLLNPSGLVIGKFEGELQANLVKKFLPICYKHYKHKLKPKLNLNPKQTELINHFEQSTKLCFPTKMCIDETNKILFVSDSGNNRILGIDLSTRRIKFQIGNGRTGHADGSFQSAMFNWPQGVCFDSVKNVLYVADTFNDLIRVIDLQTSQVRTLCGEPNSNIKIIGEYDLVGGKLGLEQRISSPWDLCLMRRNGIDVLLIACAGTHQIWLYAFQDESKSASSLIWWKNKSFETNRLICIAGNGKERNKNNSYPMQASFAQPSGLAFDELNQIVYIADAESSTVRSLSLKDGCVKNVCGGDHLQPDNLFAYGDVDGIGHQAKLQHPLDVKFIKNDNQQGLLVADTYNNSLKFIDLNTNHCSKLTNSNGSILSEPNGLLVDGACIYVADTNNHSVKLVRDFRMGQKTIQIEEFLIDFGHRVIDCVDLCSQSVSKLKFSNESEVYLLLNSSVNEKASNTWRIESKNVDGNVAEFYGVLKRVDEHMYKLEKFRIELESVIELVVHLNLVYCSKNSSTCKLFHKTCSHNKEELSKSLETNRQSKFYNSVILSSFALDFD